MKAIRPPGVGHLFRMQCPECVGKASFKQLSEFLSFFVGKARISSVGFRVLDVNLFVGHVQVATENDRLFLVQLQQISPEIVFPAHAIVKPLQSVLRIGRIAAYGNKSMFNCDKWKYLLDADFKCSASCCDIMKKSPSKKYESETGRVQYVGTMAEESRLRVEKWLQSGCNAFDNKRPTSAPMSFWTHQDVLQYLVETKIPYCSVYGDIIQDADGKYYTTGVNRTGCIFCMYGAHLEKPVNRFQYLYFSHPRQYKYCIGGGEYDESGTWIPNKQGLGLGHVMDEVGINYKPTKRLF